MDRQQKNFIASWAVGISIFILALYASETGPQGSGAITLTFGWVICRYLRKDIEIEPWRPFEVMSQKARILSAIYYLCVLCGVLYVVIKHPHSIFYSVSQFLVLLILVFLPISPVVLKRELYIFHLAGKNNA